MGREDSRTEGLTPTIVEGLERRIAELEAANDVLGRERDEARAFTSKVVSAFTTHGVEVSDETEALREALRELQEVTGFIPGDTSDAWKAGDGSSGAPMSKPTRAEALRLVDQALNYTTDDEVPRD
jgi:hypothetical protein